MESEERKGKEESEEEYKNRMSLLLHVVSVADDLCVPPLRHSSRAPEGLSCCCVRMNWTSVAMSV
jgi:hypothetical protein